VRSGTRMWRGRCLKAGRWPAAASPRALVCSFVGGTRRGRAAQRGLAGAVPPLYSPTRAQCTLTPPHTSLHTHGPPGSTPCVCVCVRHPGVCLAGGGPIRAACAVGRPVGTNNARQPGCPVLRTVCCQCGPSPPSLRLVRGGWWRRWCAAGACRCAAACMLRRCALGERAPCSTVRTQFHHQILCSLLPLHGATRIALAGCLTGIDGLAPRTAQLRNHSHGARLHKSYIAAGEQAARRWQCGVGASITRGVCAWAAMQAHASREGKIRPATVWLLSLVYFVVITSIIIVTYTSPLAVQEFLWHVLVFRCLPACSGRVGCPHAAGQPCARASRAHANHAGSAWTALMLAHGHARRFEGVPAQPLWAPVTRQRAPPPPPPPLCSLQCFLLLAILLAFFLLTSATPLVQLGRYDRYMKQNRWGGAGSERPPEHQAWGRWCCMPAAATPGWGRGAVWGVATRV